MQIFSTFEYSTYLEIAISELERRGIKKENILVVPLENRTEDRRMFDSLHRSDGVSLIDLGMALATAFSVVGASIGFKLDWGPIYWGLIAATVGFILGFAIKLFMFKVIKKKKRLLHGKKGEIIIIVECHDLQSELVKQVLWNNYALGVSQARKSNK
ncbi:hypothetical protein ACLHDF_07955 [Priestia aryabhattai]|uniref:hypothetical protein n=1 Tax=Priestia megaterium TaxID=1404 RepID=UPI0039B9B944